MLLPLLVSTLMVIATVVIHGTGIAIVGRVFRNRMREERSMHLPAMSPRVLFDTALIVVGLTAIHGIEIWLYAFVYLAIGAIGTLETAVYFSTISYAGIGYSDQYIATDWRMVAAIEGINGLLLLGWSTALFVTMIVRLGR